MDYQNRIGSKKGGGGVASDAEQNVQRKQRVSKLLSAQFDLDSDPYVRKNHLGRLECRLCLTIHLSPESYIAHSQAKKHQLNLQRRGALDNRRNNNNNSSNGQQNSSRSGISGVDKKTYTKIGQPAYKVVKIRDVETMEVGLAITVKFPQLKPGEPPMHRFMSAFEQRVDTQEGKEKWQYLVIHGEPYQNIAMKVEAREVSKEWGYWDEDLKEYYIQFFFKSNV